MQRVAPSIERTVQKFVLDAIFPYRKHRYDSSEEIRERLPGPFPLAFRKADKESIAKYRSFVTAKLDGDRFMYVYMERFGHFMLDRRFHVFQSPQWKDNGRMQNTIIDGELVKHVNGKVYYLPFDLVMWQRDNIANLPTTRRLSFFDKVFDKIQQLGDIIWLRKLIVDVKDCIASGLTLTVDKTFNTITICGVVFPFEGWIYMRGSANYLCRGSEQKKHKGKEEKKKESEEEKQTRGVVKYKIWHTFDLVVNTTDLVKQLHTKPTEHELDEKHGTPTSTMTKKRKLEDSKDEQKTKKAKHSKTIPVMSFITQNDKQTEFNTVYMNQNDIKQILAEAVVSFMVIECRKVDERYEFYRTRPDKTESNPQYIIQDTLDSIQENDSPEQHFEFLKSCQTSATQVHPANLHEYDGDLLEWKSQYIAHQTNCVTIDSRGLASEVFQRFPYADTYKDRKDRPKEDQDIPGDIQILGDGKKQRFVINMHAQLYPGYAKNLEKDSPEQRLDFFQECLDKIAKIPDLKSIAFPKFIGCDLAGGDWQSYRLLLEKFARNNPHIDVNIIHKPKPQHKPQFKQHKPFQQSLLQFTFDPDFIFD